MKVLLLIIAIYALIFNQASKQVDVKASMEVKHIKKGPGPGENIYLHRGSVPVEGSPLRQISEKMIRSATPGYMFQPAVMRENELQQSLFHPVYYPNPVNIEGRKS
ncbi:hypothetical protein LZZ85_17560 [Terrimonas sp. NA20]|uniref:Uncharacterized protein n=1 Tax=Terrimonas ginsenosidimutans TaxID=2908004 RepID=A0ABS9KUZ0_9BACT|nr:hypothetical protein [Terrimonas ginsenosidimutans]MCG2616108.1 hypothetical protein [Terrimonas ginsenosidimutans]